MSIKYRHLVCGTTTIVPDGAEAQFRADPTYAAEKFVQSPNYQGGTMCAACGPRQPRKVEDAHQFEYDDGSPVTD